MVVAPEIAPVLVMPPVLLLMPPETEAPPLAVRVWVTVNEPGMVARMPVRPIVMPDVLAAPIEIVPVVPVEVPLSTLTLPLAKAPEVTLPDAIVMPLVTAPEALGVLTTVPAKPWNVRVPAEVPNVLAALPVMLRAWLAADWIVAADAAVKVNEELVRVPPLTVPPLKVPPLRVAPLIVPKPVIVGEDEPVTVPVIVGLVMVPPLTLKPLTAEAVRVPPEIEPPVSEPPEIVAPLKLVELMVAPLNVVEVMAAPLMVELQAKAPVALVTVQPVTPTPPASRTSPVPVLFRLS